MDGNTGSIKHKFRLTCSEFVTLMAQWGKGGLGNSADFNQDGKVDILDFVLLMAYWTK